VGDWVGGFTETLFVQRLDEDALGASQRANGAQASLADAVIDGPTGNTQK
jgi:hypothetical protein